MDRKGDPERHGSKIVLKVLGPDGKNTRFKIKMLAKFKKLMKKYCTLTGLIRETLRFRFDGVIINETDTPMSMNLSNGDTIEVFESMSGGTIF